MKLTSGMFSERKMFSPRELDEIVKRRDGVVRDVIRRWEDDVRDLEWMSDVAAIHRCVQLRVCIKHLTAAIRRSGADDGSAR